NWNCIIEKYFIIDQIDNVQSCFCVKTALDFVKKEQEKYKKYGFCITINKQAFKNQYCIGCNSNSICVDTTYQQWTRLNEWGIHKQDPYCYFNDDIENDYNDDDKQEEIYLFNRLIKRETIKKKLFKQKN